MRPWFSGRMRPCQGRDAVSITAGRTIFCWGGEMADALALGASGRNPVGVQISPSAL